MNNDAHESPAYRQIRSFVRRDGRLTQGQQLALDSLWPEFGVNADQMIDLTALFGNCAPVTLEIGFGNGQSLITMALSKPDANFIGIEVHRPGVGHLLREIETHNLKNVRVICHDAVEVLHRCIPACSLKRVLLFFADPWPKTKHHKRRIVQPEFVKLIASRLQHNGLFHLATDWEPYARHMLCVMEASSMFENIAGKATFLDRPAYRPITKFETRGTRLGYTVNDLIYRKTPSKTADFDKQFHYN